MSFAELLVNAAEIIAALSAMNKAMEAYNDAVEQCNKAADELASKWEGEAKEAFVQHQATAYSWYKQMIQVVLQMIDTIRKAVEQYEEMERTVLSKM